MFGVGLAAPGSARGWPVCSAPVLPVAAAPRSPVVGLRSPRVTAPKAPAVISPSLSSRALVPQSPTLGASVTVGPVLGTTSPVPTRADAPTSRLESSNPADSYLQTSVLKGWLHDHKAQELPSSVGSRQFRKSAAMEKASGARKLQRRSQRAATDFSAKTSPRVKVSPPPQVDRPERSMFVAPRASEDVELLVKDEARQPYRAWSHSPSAARRVSAAEVVAHPGQEGRRSSIICGFEPQNVGGRASPVVSRMHTAVASPVRFRDESPLARMYSAAANPTTAIRAGAYVRTGGETPVARMCSMSARASHQREVGVATPALVKPPIGVLQTWLVHQAAAPVTRDGSPGVGVQSRQPMSPVVRSSHDRRPGGVVQSPLLASRVLPCQSTPGQASRVCVATPGVPSQPYAFVAPWSAPSQVTAPVVRQRIPFARVASSSNPFFGEQSSQRVPEGVTTTASLSTMVSASALPSASPALSSRGIVASPSARSLLGTANSDTAMPLVPPAVSPQGLSSNALAASSPGLSLLGTVNSDVTLLLASPAESKGVLDISTVTLAETPLLSSRREIAHPLSAATQLTPAHEKARPLSVSDAPTEVAPATPEIACSQRTATQTLVAKTKSGDGAEQGMLMQRIPKLPSSPLSSSRSAGHIESTSSKPAPKPGVRVSVPPESDNTNPRCNECDVAG